MNLAYKKILGKFTKVLGFGKTPPHVGKNSQMISFFFESVPYQRICMPANSAKKNSCCPIPLLSDSFRVYNNAPGNSRMANFML